MRMPIAVGLSHACAGRFTLNGSCEKSSAMLLGNGTAEIVGSNSTSGPPCPSPESLVTSGHAASTNKQANQVRIGRQYRQGDSRDARPALRNLRNRVSR